MNVRHSPGAYAVLGAIAAAFSTTALAQQDAGVELEEIVVTGSYLYTGAEEILRCPFSSDECCLTS